MKADILTKITTAVKRREALSSLNDIKLNMVRKKDLVAVKNKWKTSKPRMRIDKKLARQVIAESEGIRTQS